VHIEPVGGGDGGGLHLKVFQRERIELAPETQGHVIPAVGRGEDRVKRVADRLHVRVANQRKARAKPDPLDHLEGARCLFAAWSPSQRRAGDRVPRTGHEGRRGTELAKSVLDRNRKRLRRERQILRFQQIGRRLRLFGSRTWFSDAPASSRRSHASPFWGGASTR
jgi:hypothetical protein